MGKKTPLTLGHFEEFFRLLPERATSERSWTIDFPARQQAALEAARPYREQAEAASVQAKAVGLQLMEARKAKAAAATVAALEDQCREFIRQEREAEAKAQDIENAVYDLKAVNPNRVDTEDKRTPQELLAQISSKGTEADTALQRLQTLLAVPVGA